SHFRARVTWDHEDRAFCEWATALGGVIKREGRRLK
ncbi:MAG: hypothetical protein ACI9ND_002451, partial [Yoonia sp.]